MTRREHCHLARILASLATSLLVAGCSAGVPTPEPSSQPTMVVWVTSSATVTVTATPSADPAQSPTASGSPSPSSAPTMTVKPPTSSPTWGTVLDLLDLSSDSSKPVKESYSAIIKSASYRAGGKQASSVKLTIDKVEWNPDYSEAANPISPIRNPKVKWEQLNCGAVLVLAGADRGYTQVPLSALPKYIAATRKASYQLPFTVYTVNGRPVALVEWYVP